MTFQARILDAEALREITPAALRAYAVAQGWRRLESFGEHSDIYARANSEEVILPATATIADYSSVVSALIRIFAKAEDQSELQLYKDLSTADQDVIRVRAPSAEDDGSMRLEAGVELVVHARDLLLSAACSVTDPRPAYRAGRIKEATEYLDRVRLGQTEQGSFVVTLLSPVPPTLTEPAQTSLWPTPSEDPFERQVTRRLVQGLEAARDAIEDSNRGGGFSVFERAVQHGVSANLCEAAAKLIERGHGLDVSVTWARTRLAPERSRKISFAAPDADVLKEVARLFRDRVPRFDERLEGYIVKLVRSEDENDGHATLRTLIGNRQVSVRIDLPQIVYEAAVRAHESQSAVSVIGDLVRDKQRWRLRNPRDLVLLDVDEDAEEASSGS